MAATKHSVETWLPLAFQHPVIDVRSPGEFAHAHIPNAFSLPLFDDEERKVVGTIYKQRSREEAIKKGLEFFGPKMRDMVEQCETIIQNHPAGNKKKVLLHCWRGGMRSGAIAWLLDLYGFKVVLLEGGYKAFRNWALQQFEKDHPFALVGGYTGSAKTKVLHQLKRSGKQVLDLEGMAHHKGSAFGNLEGHAQPSTERFENEIAIALYHFSNQNPNETIWTEDESQRIGLVNVPISLWKNFREKPLYFLDVPFEERLNYLVAEYGCHDKNAIHHAILRIQKRLGGLETKTSIQALEDDDLKTCFAQLLRYYDKHYEKALQNRPQLKEVMQKMDCTSVNEIENTEKIVALHNGIKPNTHNVSAH